MPVTTSHTNSEFRDIAITDVNGNVRGVNVEQLSIASVSGLTIPGGFDTQVLSTDGAGNLSWETVGVSLIPNAVQGTSNIKVAANSSITIGVAGTANLITVSSTQVTMTGTVNFGAPNTLLVSGAQSAGYAVIGNGTGTGLQFNQSVIIPSTGYGLGRLTASGRKLFRAGDSGVLAWNGNSETGREMTINCGASAQPNYWQKIHTNSGCLYALADTGVLFCSGKDNNGQQGSGAADNSSGVLNALLDSKLYGAGITVVDFWSYDGTYTDSENVGACMVTVNDNGTFKTYIFGYNENGVLGNSTITTVNHVPVQIGQFTGLRPISVAFHVNTCMVVLSDGSVWGSGYNVDGQLGLGTNLADNPVFSRATDSTTAFITNAAEVVIGFSRVGTTSNVNAFIRKTDGTLWAAGWGALGRLAQGPDLTNKNRFVQVKTSVSTFLTNVTKIMAAAGNCVALDSNSSLYAWSTNTYGYWGTGEPDSTNNTYATIIHTSVTDFYFVQRDRDTRGLYILRNGRTWAAGYNTNGTLGTMNIASTVPIMSRIVFSEPGEYATQFAVLGTITDGGQNRVGMMFKTNKNRVYFCGANSLLRLYGGGTNTQLPLELTDIR